MTTQPPAIQVQNAAGVCSAEEDTFLLAQVSAEVAPARGYALDLGTGTGYVAIYLAQRGLRVDATDVSERALALARANAARNGAQVNLFRSNLFSDASGSYDVIVFNPPMNPGETDATRLLTSFLRRHRSLANVLMHAFDRFLDSSRVDFLIDFLEQARDHLSARGSIVLELTRLEIDELQSRLPDFEFGRRVDIPRLPTEQIVVVAPRWERAA
jgi:methylase of polypeptide subunit release factors